MAGGEPTVTLNNMTTVKMPQMQSPCVMRCQEPERRHGQDRRISDLTTTKINGNIDLPRLTDIHSATVDNHSQLLDDSLPITQVKYSNP